MELDASYRLGHHGGDRLSSTVIPPSDGSSTPSPSTQLAPGSNLSARDRDSSSSLAPPHIGHDGSETPSSHNTPQGSHSAQQGHDMSGDQQHGNDADGNDPKRSRACEACRGLKVRCEPDPNDDGPCKRCKKAGRNCVVTMPTRKRQKKTDSRVAELEKKIDALTASLQARGTPAPPVGGATQPPALNSSSAPATAIPATGASPPVMGTASSSPAPGRPSLDEPSGYGMVFGNGATRHWSMGTSPTTAHHPQQGAPRDHAPSFQPPMVMAGQKRKTLERRETMDEDSTKGAASGGQSMFKSWEGDIVDRGVLTMDKARELFLRYNDHMVHHLPAIVFPPHVTVYELRKTKPILFLSIMAAASSEIHSLQRVLQKELMQTFAEKVIMTGEKSLELVQALQVAVIWYWPPEHFEELKFYQLVHIAAVMAIDIGLGRKAAKRTGAPFTWRDNPFKRSQLPDPVTIESRRCWLMCHFMSANTSMALHRPNLVRWTPFMAESMDMLESSPDAAPSDKYLCHLVWTHHLAEEVGIQFSMDDPGNVVNLADARTQYALRAFERDMDKYQAAIPRELMQPSLRLSFNVVSLYMHEMALHPDNMTDQFRPPPFMAENLQDGIVSQESLSAAHINAISACLAAINGIFETFLSLDVLQIRTLPVFNFVRIAYSVVILLKMFFSASNASSDLGKVIGRDTLKVQYYLDALLEKFRATAADDRCRPAAKFLVVLAMLRSWFFKQMKADAKGPLPRPNAETNRPSENAQSLPMHGPQQPSYQSPQQQGPNTPLHLLSEAAVGDSSAAHRGGPFGGMGGLRQPQAFYPDGPSPNSGTPPGANAPPVMSMPPAMGGPPLPTAGSGEGVDYGAAMAPAFPPWPATQGVSPEMAMSGGAPGAFNGFTFDGLSLSPETQNAFEGGARYMVNEPWFNDMMFSGGLPDPNLFF